jgi:hypothetical protein
MLYRHNLTLTDSNSAWLDRLSEEIRLEGEPLGDRPRCYLGASRTSSASAGLPISRVDGKEAARTYPCSPWLLPVAQPSVSLSWIHPRGVRHGRIETERGCRHGKCANVCASCAKRNRGGEGPGGRFNAHGIAEGVCEITITRAAWSLGVMRPTRHWTTVQRRRRS